MKWITYILENSDKVVLLTGQHIFLFAVSMAAALVIGIALSIYSTRPGKERIGTLIISVTGASQAIPPLAVIALIFIFVGIGAVPSIIALGIYSIVPIAFNATSGLLSVSSSVTSAATGTGFTERQILWKVKLPVSMPVIMAGIRSAATINIGTATVASFIGGGGLGDLIFMGIKLYRFDIIMAGAILVAILAILVDGILKIVENAVVSRGLRI